MVRDTANVARRMLQLKMIFPTANMSLMVANRPSLVLDDNLDLFRDRFAIIREQLPGVNVERMVQVGPSRLPFS